MNCHPNLGQTIGYIRDVIQSYLKQGQTKAPMTSADYENNVTLLNLSLRITGRWEGGCAERQETHATRTPITVELLLHYQDSHCDLKKKKKKKQQATHT